MEGRHFIFLIMGVCDRSCLSVLRLTIVFGVGRYVIIMETGAIYSVGVTVDSGPGIVAKYLDEARTREEIHGVKQSCSPADLYFLLIVPY
jgi:hypothetical protein